MSKKVTFIRDTKLGQLNRHKMLMSREAEFKEAGEGIKQSKFIELKSDP